MFLSRKITRSKWEDRRGMGAGEIPADAVTADLRTHGNSLSFWECGDGKKPDVEGAVLALASAQDRLEKVEMVWVAVEELQQAADQRLKYTQGKTPVVDLVDQHVDVCGLDYVRIGAVARRIVAALAEKRYKRFPKGVVKALLVNAIEMERLKLEDLQQRVKDEIEKHRASCS